MGVKRLIVNAILGPLFVYFLLMLHVGYHVVFKKPEPIAAPSWPPGTSEAAKNDVVASRKALIADFMDAAAGKNLHFMKKHATEDIEVEDPIQRSIGFEEVSAVMNIAQRITKDCQFTITGEHHSAHEVVMDWVLKYTVKFMPNHPIVLGMRTHFLLEPSSKAGGPEKVFKIYEEWNGNVLLTEKTFTPSVVGKVHSKLRRFLGYMLSQAILSGYV